MNALELKIPPPLVTAIVAILMWMVSHATPTLGFAFDGRWPMVWVLVLVGATIGGMGIRAFRHANTTVNPMRPDQTSLLVSSGVYRYTRNPMYLGLLLHLVAWGVFLANAAALVLLPVFVLYLQLFQIVPEERVLAAHFGQQFADYKARVRRWI